MPDWLKTILESIGDSALIIDRDGRVVFANERSRKKDGRSLDGLISEDGRIQGVPAEVVDGIAEVLAGGAPCWKGRIEGRGRDGATHARWVEVVPIRDDPRAEASCVVVLREIDEAAEVAKERIAYLEQVIDAIPNPVYLKDTELRYINCNKAYEEFFGTTRESIRGKNIGDLGLLDDDVAAIRMREDREIVAGGGSRRFRSSVRFRDGKTRETLFLVSCLQDGRGVPTGLLGVVVDITDLDAKERELAEARDRAEQEMRNKTMFLANMSHEVRTPLNALVGMTHLLAGMELGPRQRQHAEKIRTAGLALQALVDDLLDYTRLEVGQIELSDTVFGFDEIFRILDAVLGDKARAKGLSFLLECDPELLGSFRGDKHRIGQILTNLAGNAVKFTPFGTVEVGCRIVDRRGDEVKVRFGVSDTGIGMSEEQIGRLFRPFTQGDGSITRRFGGSGLGLCISGKLVEIMGGRLQVDSHPDRGSIFHFELWMPRVSHLPDVPETSFDDAVLRDAPLRDLRILLVEDEQLNRETMADLLSAEGANVLASSSGAEALSILREEEGDVDIVLMDIGLPGMTGMEAAGRMREDRTLRDIPVVALTAHVMDDDSEYQSAGFVDFLSKPCTPERLRETILHWASHGCDSAADSGLLGERQEFDKHGGLKRSGGSKGYIEALLRFRREQGGALDEVARLVADGRRVEAQVLVRRLRAEAAYIGGTELQRRARILEVGLGSSADVGKTLASVERAYARLAREILALLDDHDSSGDDAEPVAPPDDELLARLGEHLRRSDGAAIDLYDVIERGLRSWFGPERAGEFDDAIRLFDFDRAYRILDGERMRRRRDAN